MKITCDPAKNAANLAERGLAFELIDDENPEWTDAMLTNARPAAQVLPELFGTQTAQAMLKPRGRPAALVVKERITIRFDADVLEAFRATGKGWQTRVNDAIREWLGANSFR